MDSTPRREQLPQQPDAWDDYLAHLHLLVDHYVACGQRLRGLHDRFLALQHEPMSDEQRGAQISQLLHDEFDVLAEAHALYEALQAHLRERPSRLHGIP